MNDPVANTQLEWDPLEEIIAGIVESAKVTPWEPVAPLVVHHEFLLDFYRDNAGKPWPHVLLDAGRKISCRKDSRNIYKLCPEQEFPAASMLLKESLIRNRE